MIPERIQAALRPAGHLAKAVTVAGCAFSLGALTGCDDSTTRPEDRIVEGVNLTQLFAQPGPAEIAAIEADWNGRDVSAQDVQVVLTEQLDLGGVAATLQIVSHSVAGVRHYGAILVPNGAAAGSLPILVYTHGGDRGVDIDDLLFFLPIFLGPDVGKSIFVAPSFRAEPLRYQGVTYTSEGEPSPWDYDVDDALALLNVVAATTAEADADRIGILGFSRGACVALLMAERDPRIDLVVEFFGPTDFFGPFVQEVVEEALLGAPRDLPGLDFLNQEYIQPLKNGETTIADVRPEILRRSPVYFAASLTQLQVHHGTDDDTVPVGEAERLIEVMSDLGRGEPEFEAYLYEGGTHNPLSLDGSIERTREFLGRLLPQQIAVPPMLLR
ncbi:MAG: dienelactone hydrolase family protein [Gemmatimonadota bacterium]|nr:MAG: dienelactone hydrolase family protein [Gemmatimonadota bacterium]